MDIKLIAQNAVRIVNKNGKVIYFDPFELKGEYLNDADMIFITHSHYDHFSPKDVEQIKNDNTKIIVTNDLTDKVINIGFKGDSILTVLPNNEYEFSGIKFRTILSGKLRRYFSFRNFVDGFKVIIGCFQAFIILLFHRVDVVFSKGGFVSVPVCVAAKVLRIRIITHEADLSVGLANRIIARLADKICYSFEDTKKYLPSTKAVFTGIPIRDELLQGNRERGFSFCGFDQDDPRKILLIMGGSLGALRINKVVDEVLDELCKNFRVVHITGKHQSHERIPGSYAPFQSISKELKDVFSIVDFVVARSGANSIFEYLALKIPMLLIPLKIGSRGDQVQNAEYFEKKGYALVLDEMKLDKDSFLKAIFDLKENSESIKATMSKFSQNSSKIIEDLIFQE